MRSEPSQPSFAPAPRLLDDGAAVEVRLGGETHRFHAMWLRDNAQDAATRSPGNGQKLITLLDLPEATRVSEARWVSERLCVRFKPEGVEIGFQADWLLAHARRTVHRR